MIKYAINEFAFPIEYVLKCLKDGVTPNSFHVENAIVQWESIKKAKPVAYADEKDGVLTNFRTENTRSHNQVRLFKRDF